MSIVEKTVQEFVKILNPFTSVDISNNIKMDGIWVKNSEVSNWLHSFSNHAYTKTLIDVTSTEKAFLYHPISFDINLYSGQNQIAITPDEFEKKYKKKVADSLLNIFDSENMKNILDRSKNTQSVIDKIFEYWGYDLFSRSPGPAYSDDGIFVGTDLDLACFLFALAERGAVINLPEYEGRRPKQITAGEMIVSKNNRHGKVSGVLANKENFSFSVRINDMNVMTTDSVGNFRNFLVVDFDGTFYDGWKTIDFIPNAKENDFIEQFKIASGNKISFKNFIHPNRWTSFYGQYYYLTKVLLERLTEEAKFLKTTAAAMREKGLGEEVEKKVWAKKTTVGNKESILVKVFEAEVSFPDFQNVFEAQSLLVDYKGTTDAELLKALEDRSRILSYSIIPKIRFFTRATEFAFHFNSNDGNKKPAWIRNVDWNRSFVFPGKKKVWNNLELSNDVSIRYRVYDKSEIVSETSED